MAKKKTTPKKETTKKTKSVKRVDKVAKSTPVSAPALTASEKWIAFAKQNGVTKPFFTTQGKMIRTSDGKEYSTAIAFTIDGAGGNNDNIQNLG